MGLRPSRTLRRYLSKVLEGEHLQFADEVIPIHRLAQDFRLVVLSDDSIHVRRRC